MKGINKYITDFFIDQCSIDISKYDESFLNNSLQKRIAATNSTTAEKYFEFLEQNRMEREIYLGSLYVNYSEFFRNQLTFSVLDRIILPELIYGKRNRRIKEIRIWSAACASGQETYSLAMLLEEFNNGSEKVEYRIFGTDQDETQIHKARIGEFNAASIGNVTRKQVMQWFVKKGSTYAVISELKKNIEFSVFDLLSEKYSSPPESIFGEFDIVICANLLFYYKPEYRRIIVDKIEGSLGRGGLVITGESEREIFMKFNFKEIYNKSAIFQLNNTGRE